MTEILVPTADADLKLRPARPSDVHTYFSWTNDPVVRANALDTRPISLKTHVGWFEARLKEPGSHLFILEAGGLPVGQVRFQGAGPEALISYSLDSLVRHRGWAKRLLALGIEALFSVRTCKLKAIVKQENVASAATFSRLGFTELSPAGGLRTFELKPSGPGVAGQTADMRVGE